jgi:RNA-splicing ligase RtcB
MTVQCSIPRSAVLRDGGRLARRDTCNGDKRRLRLTGIWRSETLSVFVIRVGATKASPDASAKKPAGRRSSARGLFFGGEMAGRPGSVRGSTGRREQSFDKLSL